MKKLDEELLEGLLRGYRDGEMYLGEYIDMLRQNGNQHELEHICSVIASTRPDVFAILRKDGAQMNLDQKQRFFRWIENAKQTPIIAASYETFLTFDAHSEEPSFSREENTRKLYRVQEAVNAVASKVSIAMLIRMCRANKRVTQDFMDRFLNELDHFQPFAYSLDILRGMAHVLKDTDIKHPVWRELKKLQSKNITDAAMTQAMQTMFTRSQVRFLNAALVDSMSVSDRVCDRIYLAYVDDLLHTGSVDYEKVQVDLLHEIYPRTFQVQIDSNASIRDYVWHEYGPDAAFTDANWITLYDIVHAYAKQNEMRDNYAQASAYAKQKLPSVLDFDILDERHANLWEHMEKEDQAIKLRGIELDFTPDRSKEQLQLLISVKRLIERSKCVRTELEKEGFLHVVLDLYHAKASLFVQYELIPLEAKQFMKYWKQSSTRLWELDRWGFEMLMQECERNHTYIPSYMLPCHLDDMFVPKVLLEFQAESRHLYFRIIFDSYFNQNPSMIFALYDEMLDNSISFTDFMPEKDAVAIAKLLLQYEAFRDMHEQKLIRETMTEAEYAAWKMRQEEEKVARKAMEDLLEFQKQLSDNMRKLKPAGTFNSVSALYRRAKYYDMNKIQSEILCIIVKRLMYDVLPALIGQSKEALEAYMRELVDLWEQSDDPVWLLKLSDEIKNRFANKA